VAGAVIIVLNHDSGVIVFATFPSSHYSVTLLEILVAFIILILIVCFVFVYFGSSAFDTGFGKCRTRMSVLSAYFSMETWVCLTFWLANAYQNDT
jgi:hypothetical protein